MAPDPERDRDAALAELARRFRAAYGPGDGRDLQYWSGMPAGDAKRAWELAGPAPDAPGATGRPLPVRLLPSFDGYLLGHRDRSPILRPEDAPKLTSGSWILPTVVVDGRVVGTWKPVREKGGLTVAVTPFGRLPRGCVRALRVEAADVGRFLGTPARMEFAAALRAPAGRVAPAALAEPAAHGGRGGRTGRTGTGALPGAQLVDDEVGGLTGRPAPLGLVAQLGPGVGARTTAGRRRGEAGEEQVERPRAVPGEAVGRSPDVEQRDHQVPPRPPVDELGIAMGGAQPDRDPAGEVELGRLPFPLPTQIAHAGVLPRRSPL